jgi:rhamnosyltransferase
MKKNVLIMLASYNGEKYIEQQIDSIIGQDYPYWHLIIQDDGSTDETRNILESYSNQDKRIEWHENETDYHGPFYNFFSLINKCKTEIHPYDYYMFCDHDDVWFPDKISSFIDRIDKEEETSEPFLCYADMNVIDSNDKVIETSMERIYHNGYLNRYSVFFCHKIFGCNLMMNAAAFYKVPLIDIANRLIEPLSHDNLYAKFVAVFGKIIYLPKITMGYRRYEQNVTKGHQFKVTPRRFFLWFSHLRSMPEKHSFHLNMSLIAIATIRTQNLTREQKTFVDNIESCIRNGGIKGLLFMQKHHISWGENAKGENISHKLTILLGKYRKYLYPSNENKLIISRR